MLGHDYAPPPVRVGSPGLPRDHPTRYLFLHRVAIPALIEEGVDPDVVELMVREVPRRFLTGMR